MQKYFSTLYTKSQVLRDARIRAVPHKGQKVILQFLNLETGGYDVLEVSNNGKKTPDNKTIYIYEMFRK